MKVPLQVLCAAVHSSLNCLLMISFTPNGFKVCSRPGTNACIALLAAVKCSASPCRESGASRTVTHYHYHAWPDRGIPRTTLPLRRLARLLDATDDPQAGPPVVHCSAGIGRTGVFLVSPCP